MGALLALLALLGMNTLSTWHGSTFHSEEPAEATSPQAHHAGHGTVDSDNTVHIAAHVLAQGMALPSTMDAAVYIATVDTGWLTDRPDFVAGLHPTSLLRPPRR